MSRIGTTNLSISIPGRLGAAAPASSNASALARLAAGVQIRRAVGVDTVDVTPSARVAASAADAAPAGRTTATDGVGSATQPAASDAASALDQIDGLLAQVQGLVLDAQANPQPREQAQATQIQIDSLIQQIDRAASLGNVGYNPFFGGGKSFQVAQRSLLVDEFHVGSASVQPGEVHDVDVLVTQSARTGDLFLNFGDYALDLSAAISLLTLEIGGADGVQQLSFASGTTIYAVVDAINYFGQAVGAHASLQGAGVAITSNKDGANGFVSVRVVDDGGIGVGRTGQAGIYRLTGQFGSTVVDPASRVAFGSQQARDGVVDQGQDVQGTIDGVQAVGQGRTLSIHTGDLDVSLTLTQLGASTTTVFGPVRGVFTALRIGGVGVDPSSLPYEDPHGATDSFLFRPNAAHFLGHGRYDSSGAGGGVPFSVWDLSDVAGSRALDIVDGYIPGAIRVIAQARLDVDALRNTLSLPRARGPALDPPAPNPGVSGAQAAPAATGPSDLTDAAGLAQSIRDAALAAASRISGASVRTAADRTLSLLSQTRAV